MCVFVLSVLLQQLLERADVNLGVIGAAAEICGSEYWCLSVQLFDFCFLFCVSKPCFCFVELVSCVAAVAAGLRRC